ncbi:hypothetical protein EVAR_54815_1 [Eumeta japonica]|uniref:Uncharacterized protein n=1 Tax=Eumeta variegata TaxID=151549 RepID=A0A4C1Y0H3_EUMVA|nr:hypothetical protein EVAR_54815_1 [Eumeta japonica]
MLKLSERNGSIIHEIPYHHTPTLRLALYQRAQCKQIVDGRLMKVILFQIKPSTLAQFGSGAANNRRATNAKTMSTIDGVTCPSRPESAA